MIDNISKRKPWRKRIKQLQDDEIGTCFFCDGHDIEECCGGGGGLDWYACTTCNASWEMWSTDNIISGPRCIECSIEFNDVNELLDHYDTCNRHIISEIELENEKIREKSMKNLEMKKMVHHFEVICTWHDGGSDECCGFVLRHDNCDMKWIDGRIHAMCPKHKLFKDITDDIDLLMPLIKIPPIRNIKIKHKWYRCEWCIPGVFMYPSGLENHKKICKYRPKEPRILFKKQTKKQNLPKQNIDTIDTSVIYSHSYDNVERLLRRYHDVLDLNTGQPVYRKMLTVCEHIKNYETQQKCMREMSRKQWIDTPHIIEICLCIDDSIYAIEKRNTDESVIVISKCPRCENQSVQHYTLEELLSYQHIDQRKILDEMTSRKLI